MKILSIIQNARYISGSKSGNLKRVEDALKGGADINTRQKNGWSAWMNAHANCDNQMVKFLESKGIEVTDADRLTAGITAGMNKACHMIPQRGHVHHAKAVRS